MVDVNIRKGVPKDTPSIDKLLREICLEFNWDYEKDFERHDANPDYYLTHNGRLYVAIAMGKLVGTIGYIRKGNIAMLVRFYVLPEYRNQGIGMRLHQVLMNELKRQRIEVIFLGTTYENITYLRSFLQQDNFMNIYQLPATFQNEVSDFYFQKVLI